MKPWSYPRAQIKIFPKGYSPEAHDFASKCGIIFNQFLVSFVEKWQNYNDFCQKNVMWEVYEVDFGYLEELHKSAEKGNLFNAFA